MTKRSTIALLLMILALGALAQNAPAPQPPAEGSAAPTFRLPSQEGAPVALADLAGKWVVLYFYPKDFTSGCTLQAKNFQRDLAKYHQANAVVVGVSLDSVDSHKEFCTKESLDFKLLADTDKKVSTAYGSLSTYDGKEYAARNTFLIDPKGVIRKVYLKVKPTGHSDEVLADLAALQDRKR